MGSLLGNVGSPSPQIFRNYVGQLRGISDLNGVVGLGWIERFGPEDLADLRRRFALPTGNAEEADAPALFGAGDLARLSHRDAGRRIRRQSGGRPGSTMVLRTPGLPRWIGC